MKLDTARCRHFHWRNGRATLNRNESIGAIALAQSSQADLRSIGGFPNSGGKIQCQSGRFPRFWGMELRYEKALFFKFKDMKS
jgi:hypothetical protein